MLGSESRFFFSDEDTLEKTREVMVNFLKLHKTNPEVINIYIKAYNYFIKNPSRFDGATILKDVKIIPGLDIWAMLHDYMYINFNVAVNWKYKFISDKIYSEEMERIGLSWEVTWVRFGLLLITHLLFTPYEIIRGKRMNNTNKFNFLKIYSFFKK